MKDHFESLKIYYFTSVIYLTEILMLMFYSVYVCQYVDRHFYI